MVGRASRSSEPPPTCGARAEPTVSHQPGPAVASARAAAAPLATAFADAGHRPFLVGGLVRDDLLGRVRDDVDYDLTTDARPEAIKELIEPFADAVWTAGERFGTIACRIGGVDYEITTFMTALERYRINAGHYPSDKQGLMALFKKPTTEPIPRRWVQIVAKIEAFKDPWGNPYRYQLTDGKPVISSLGPDGKVSEDDISY